MGNDLTTVGYKCLLTYFEFERLIYYSLVFSI